MAETVIELDLSSPWEPPEPPAPRRLLRTRWVAACVVLTVALGWLVASGAGARTGPLYLIKERVRSVDVAGDMLIMGRFRQAGADPQIEGRRRSDGKLLWSIPADLQDQNVTVGATALMLIRYDYTTSAFASSITALDTATGRQLWTRPRTVFIGANGGLVVVEEMIVPERVIQIPAGEEMPDLTVNDAGDQQPRHLMVLDERTGVPVWEFTTPVGAAIEVTWDGRFATGKVTGIEQLDTSGSMTRRDIRTGAVVSTRQLDWSGTPARVSTGTPWLVRPGRPGRAPARAVVYPDGQRGGLVFDLADGRLLFHTATAIFDGYYQCAADLFCTTFAGGIAAYDSTTGERAWGLDNYTEVLAAAGDRFVVGTSENGMTSGRLAVVDARTGAVIEKLTDWQLIGSAFTGRLLLWRALDTRTALLGELDPATGGITVFGRAADWYGPPECDVGGDTLACIMVGDATVWHLPPQR